MKLFTEIEIPKSPWQLTADSRILLIGSCFTDSIGQKMLQHGLHAESNPTGVLYNPLSIVQSLNGDMRVELVQHEGLYHSMSHHGSFSGADSEQVLRRCLQSLAQLHQAIDQADVVFVTFGTAYVYYRNGNVVANCHKLPEAEFTRRRLTVDEILAAWRPVIRTNTDKHWVFTVSPIRHKRDGMHNNQLSKAVLLMAIEQLQQDFPEQVTYFPAYEIVLDELRDYRFYDSDMVHLSKTAEEYIFERMVETYCDEKSRTNIARVEKFMKMAGHRIVDASSHATQEFKKKLASQAADLEKQIAGLSLH